MCTALMPGARFAGSTAGRRFAIWLFGNTRMPHKINIKAYPGEKGGLVLLITGLPNDGDYIEIAMERITASHLAMDIEEITGGFSLKPLAP